MVVNNLNIRWTGSPSRPFKADPPLVIDADAVLSLPFALQSFESIAPVHVFLADARPLFQKVKTILRQVSSGPSPERVHQLRTTIRRVESLLVAAGKERS